MPTPVLNCGGSGPAGGGSGRGSGGGGVLSGVRVVEISGLAPAPFCGLLLADFGADVVVVDRLDRHGQPVQPLDTLRRGKRSIALDLKSAEGRAIFLDLARGADVLLEPFRPGKMEALGLGPERLLHADFNPRLVYGRMTGFGQGGVAAVRDMAGHDINYLAIAGILSALAKDGQAPHPPINLLGDFAGGGMMLAFGVLLALLERQRSGCGQVVDAAMLDGANYISKFVWDAHGQGGWRNGARAGGGAGQNLLDGAAPFYRTYRCRCGGFVAVGAIERQFYAELLAGLGLAGSADKARVRPQMDRARWPAVHRLFEERFAARTRDEWAQVFMGRDACVTPVLSMAEATKFPHNRARDMFLEGPHGTPEPCAAPKLSRTPGLNSASSAQAAFPDAGEHTVEILRELGVGSARVRNLLREGAAGSSLDEDEVEAALGQPEHGGGEGAARAKL